MTMLARDCKPGMWYGTKYATWLVLSTLIHGVDRVTINYLHTTREGQVHIFESNYLKTSDVFGNCNRLG